jgi:hypothetical protein
MIKKYGIGLLALFIAVFAAAFTNHVDSPSATQLFRYTAPGGSYAVADVQNKANWSLVTGSPNCPSNIDERACEMDVDQSQLNPDNSLKPSFTITASEFESTGVGYVSSITAGNIHNKNV